MLLLSELSLSEEEVLERHVGTRTETLLRRRSAGHLNGLCRVESLLTAE